MRNPKTRATVRMNLQLYELHSCQFGVPTALGRSVLSRHPVIRLSFGRSCRLVNADLCSACGAWYSG